MKTLSLLLLLSACGDDRPEPPPEPAPVREIDGVARFIAIDEANQRTNFPIGLHDTLVSAQFPVGDGWTVIEGTSHVDGTFAIEQAPEGPYWLDVYDVPTGQRQLLWTDATNLAFEELGIGRGDAVLAGAGSTLTFAVDGLDPVQADDGFQLASGNLGISANLFAFPDPSSTTLDFTRPWSGQPLISAAAHDKLILTQLRTTVDPTTSFTYTSPIRAVTFDAIEQLDRQDTTLTGTLVTPPELDYHLVWKRSAFAEAAADIHPSRVGPVTNEICTLRAMPGTPVYGTSPFSSLVLGIDPSVFTGDATDFDQTFVIRNPYPESWLYNDFDMQFPVTIPVPGTPGATIEEAGVIEVNTNQLASASNPIVPLVTPPLTPTIDGLDLFADHDGVSTTPVIAWSPPAHGTPTAYVLFVNKWEIDPGFADLAQITTLIVPPDVTSVRVPAHLLEPGASYLLRVAAISQPGEDVRVHSLYTSGDPYGFAELWTNTFTVAATAAQ